MYHGSECGRAKFRVRRVQRGGERSTGIDGSDPFDGSQLVRLLQPQNAATLRYCSRAALVVQLRTS